MSTFPERLKQVRGKLDQGEMSTQLGIHLTSYGRYERGERSPDLEFIEKVCRTFNVSPTWLILGEGPMRPGEITPGEAPGKLGYIDPAVEMVEEAIIETGVQINDRQKRFLVEVIRDEMLKRTGAMLKALKGFKTEE